MQLDSRCVDFLLCADLFVAHVARADLDLCRNIAFLVKDQPWQCERCSAEYDRAAIEALVIDALQRRVVSYQLQDLRCGKCKTMKAENLRASCDCSGEYRMSETKQELAKRLQVTVNVADFHKLTILSSVVDWLRDVVHWCVSLRVRPPPLVTDLVILQSLSLSQPCLDVVFLLVVVSCCHQQPRVISRD